MKSYFKSIKNLGNVQFLIMSFIWILLFAIPLLVSDSTYGIEWNQVFKIWLEYALVFLVFIINHFVLFPQFLKGKRILYFASVAVLLALLLLATQFLNSFARQFLQEMQPMQSMESMMGRRPGPPPGRGPKEFIPPYINLLIISILLLGFDVGLSFARKWLQAEQNKIMLQKENVENKMAFLQNQISPHFFMNTLNNIHALVDIDTEEAKEAIIKLSQMMAYMLYESRTERISIKKEIEFINSYVELMKLRFSEEVEIKLEIPEALPEISLPPLLTISFIENAFKHGISYETTSFVHMKYIFKKDRMYFELQNTNFSKPEKTKNSGIGLENIKKRLALIYAKDFELKIDSSDPKVYTVHLNIPV